MLRVFFAYQTTDLPYGGANSFIKLLKTGFQSSPVYGIVPTDDIAHADVIFLNAASGGPCVVRTFSFRKLKFVESVRDRPVSVEEIRNLSMGKIPVVHRLDGLTAIYGRADGQTYDNLQISLNEQAAHTVFQSDFCRESFLPHLKKDMPHSIVFNGTDGGLFQWSERKPPRVGGKIRVLASSWSKNPKKGHVALAEFSKLPEIDVVYIGRWPEEISPAHITIEAPARREEVARAMRNFHVFAHFAQNDPAPNVVTEALASGLPVIYHQSGGTPEIVQGESYGEPVSETSLGEMSAALNKLMTRYESLIQKIKIERERFLMPATLQAYRKVFSQAAIGKR